MNIRHFIAVATLAGSFCASAQNVSQEPQEDPVQKAIREFKQGDSGPSKEVTVVLPPPEDEAPAEPKPAEVQTENEAVAAEEPVLVTGKAPEGTELLSESTTESTEDPSPNPQMEEPAREPQKGLAVRVAKLQSGKGNIDPSKVKLLAPFPAKPLSQPPAGWRLETSEQAPPFTREVELSPGKKITLTVRPHLLVPESDGASVFSVHEPGFDASLGYCQNATVGAVLSKSIRQLDDDSKQLGDAIDNLQQLLTSLPKPEPEPTPAPEPPKTNPRKR